MINDYYKYIYKYIPIVKYLTSIFVCRSLQICINSIYPRQRKPKISKRLMRVFCFTFHEILQLRKPFLAHSSIFFFFFVCSILSPFSLQLFCLSSSYNIEIFPQSNQSSFSYTDKQPPSGISLLSLSLSLSILLSLVPLFFPGPPLTCSQSPPLYFNYLSPVLPKTLAPSTRTGCCFVCALMATKLAKCCQYPFATFLANNTKFNNVAATTFSLPASVQLSAEREFTPKAQGVIVLSRF